MKHEMPPAIVASARHEPRPDLVASIGGMSFRPLGYLHSLTIGFVIGCLAFLIGSAGGNATANLTVLLASAGAGAALALAVNFVAERRIRAKLDSQRAGFARYMFGPQPR